MATIAAAIVTVNVRVRINGAACASWKLRALGLVARALGVPLTIAAAHVVPEDR